MMRTLGEALVAVACAIFCVVALMAAGVDWGALPVHPEGF